MIRTQTLTELMQIFPGDATVRGFDEGITVKNADGTGEVLLLNDNFFVPVAAETCTRHPTPSDGTPHEEALDTTDPTPAHKLRIVPRRPPR
jgi:hypothetical protein